MNLDIVSKEMKSKDESVSLQQRFASRKQPKAFLEKFLQSL